MIDQRRTLSARLITRGLRRPRALVVRAWFWLAAEAANLDDQRRCLEAILKLDPETAPATAVLQWVPQCQQQVVDLHPANAEEPANIAKETGAEVLRGALRYPCATGGWQLGDADEVSIWTRTVTTSWLSRSRQWGRLAR